MFAGMVVGALGWDSAHNIPPALEGSLEEARQALSIANYRYLVVMCRRSLEALLKFAFPRLLVVLNGIAYLVAAPVFFFDRLDDGNALVVDCDGLAGMRFHWGRDTSTRLASRKNLLSSCSFAWFDGRCPNQ